MEIYRSTKESNLAIVWFFDRDAEHDWLDFSPKKDGPTLAQGDSVVTNARFFLDGPVEVTTDLDDDQRRLPVELGQGRLRIGSGQLMVGFTSDRGLADAVPIEAGGYAYELTADAPVDPPRINLSLTAT